jgi:hypothetical protein
VCDNTIVAVNLVSDGKTVGISVKTESGAPIPANVLFNVWLLDQTNQTQNVNAKAMSCGPFIVKSIAGSFDIDVDNLKNIDGTKGSISAGEYVVKFADADEKYVGTTEPITLKATGSTPPDNNEKKGGGGGCNAGYGLLGLLFTSFVVRRVRPVK